MAELGVLTQVEAEERLRYWQKVLRLGDWNIRVEIVGAQELDTYYGLVNKWNTRDAWVRLKRAEDIPSHPVQNTDMEVTLVHELVHLRLADMGWPKDDTPQNDAFEAASEAIAQALVSLERRNRFT